jgi:hypothetical protein
LHINSFVRIVSNIGSASCKILWELSSGMEGLEAKLAAVSAADLHLLLQAAKLLLHMRIFAVPSVEALCGQLDLRIRSLAPKRKLQETSSLTLCKKVRVERIERLEDGTTDRCVLVPDTGSALDAGCNWKIDIMTNLQLSTSRSEYPLPRRIALKLAHGHQPESFKRIRGGRCEHFTRPTEYKLLRCESGWRLATKDAFFNACIDTWQDRQVLQRYEFECHLYVAFAPIPFLDRNGIPGLTPGEYLIKCGYKNVRKGAEEEDLGLYLCENKSTLHLMYEGSGVLHFPLPLSHAHCGAPPLAAEQTLKSLLLNFEGLQPCKDSGFIDVNVQGEWFRTLDDVGLNLILPAVRKFSQCPNLQLLQPRLNLTKGPKAYKFRAWPYSVLEFPVSRERVQRRTVVKF